MMTWLKYLLTSYEKNTSSNDFKEELLRACKIAVLEFNEARAMPYKQSSFLNDIIEYVSKVAVRLSDKWLLSEVMASGFRGLPPTILRMIGEGISLFGFKSMEVESVIPPFSRGQRQL